MPSCPCLCTRSLFAFSENPTFCQSSKSSAHLQVVCLHTTNLCPVPRRTVTICTASALNGFSVKETPGDSRQPLPSSTKQCNKGIKTQTQKMGQKVTVGARAGSVGTPQQSQAAGPRSLLARQLPGVRPVSGSLGQSSLPPHGTSLIKARMTRHPWGPEDGLAGSVGGWAAPRVEAAPRL